MRESPPPGGFRVYGPGGMVHAALGSKPYSRGEQTDDQPMERVENRIQTIRGHRVMLNADLAEQGHDTVGGRAAGDPSRFRYPPAPPPLPGSALIFPEPPGGSSCSSGISGDHPAHPPDRLSPERLILFEITESPHCRE